MNALVKSLIVISFVWVLLILSGTPVRAQSYTVAYSYDAQGRLTVAEYSTSEGLAYQYDAAGNITSVQPVEVLPVELTSFEAVVDAGEVRLTWTTASETNNAGFEVQKQEEKEEWEKIAFVKGAGTTTEPQTYHYRAIDLPVGVHLFRLKQIDVDGHFEFSPVVEVDLGAPAQFALYGAYPNPARGTATIAFDVARATSVHLEVYDVLGRQVAVLVDEERTPGRHVAQMSTTRLATGLYFYRIQMDDFQEVKRLVVVR